MFAYQPALLMIGTWYEVISAAVSAIVGTIVLAASLEGWLIGRIRIVERIFLAAAGLCCIYPGTITDIIGIAIITVVVLMGYKRNKKAAET